MQIPALIIWEEPKNSLNRLGLFYLHKITDILSDVKNNIDALTILENLINNDDLLRLYYHFYLDKQKKSSMFWDGRLLVVFLDPKFLDFISYFTFDQLRQAISDNPNHFNISNHEIAELINYYYER